MNLFDKIIEVFPTLYLIAISILFESYEMGILSICLLIVMRLIDIEWKLSEIKKNKL